MNTGWLGFFLKKDQRTLQINKNILFSFLLKIGSVIITFLLVPLTIDYISPVQYGIWLTISSIVYWINVFDIGIGNGLKNEIAYSLAIKDERNLKAYVSTSYAVLTIIAVLIFALFFLISYFINWSWVLNIAEVSSEELRRVMIIVMGFFCIQFIVQVIDAVLGATQQVFKSSFILFTGQLLGLIVIYLLTLFVPGSLLLLVTVMAGSSVIVLIIASLYLYSTELKKFAPGFGAINFKYIRKLLTVGGAFFIIQIGAMILINANNFIITRILGPEAVTIYNIPFRLFSFISMLFAIIIIPYWSAFTDAYATKDMDWIKTNIKKLRIFWLGLSLLGVVVFVMSGFVYKVWIHNAVVVPVSLSLCVLLYIVVYMWHTLHVYFLNGIGKIRLQLLVVTAGVIFNIPLAVYAGRAFGLPGIVCANILTFTIMGLIYTLQYKKLVLNTASGIWNR